MRMSNILFYLPVPAILLLLFLLVNIVIILILKRRISVQKSKRVEPAIVQVKDEKIAESTKKLERKRKERSTQPRVIKLFYILGIFSWIVLLWPIVVFLQTKSQISPHMLLQEDKITSAIPPLSEKQCNRILFLDEDGREISVEEISGRFLPGDVIFIAVKPRKGESVDKTRIRINSSIWTEDSEIREKNTRGFFILECAVDALSDGRPTVCGMPIGERGKFAVEAEIFDSEEGVWR